MMKRHRFTVLALACLLLAAAAGCGASSGKGLVKGKVNVVTSFYTMYDFTQKIGGKHVNVINLVPAGVEPHDWTPKSKDIQNITKSELLIYNGAGFEGWIDQFLSGAGSGAKVKAVEASRGIELINSKGEHADGEHNRSLDPHTWVSPKSALVIAANIRDALVEVDPEHKPDYDANYEVLHNNLAALDQRFATALAGVKRKELVTSHQAFGYLCRDYGLTQMPIMGLSPDAEPRGQDLVKISRFVKEHDVTTIFFEELVSGKLAKTLAKDTGVKTMVLNPLEGLTQKEEKAGEDYISVMDHNLQNLLKALQ